MLGSFFRASFWLIPYLYPDLLLYTILTLFGQEWEGESDWRQEMESAFAELLLLLRDDNTMSAYELHSSGLVQALFNCLNVSTEWVVTLLSEDSLIGICIKRGIDLCEDKRN